MTTAHDALARLKAGNQRFVDGNSDIDAEHGPTRRDQLISGQSPFAIVLGCADSRVPVERVFDQDLGDLFVVRVAGNIVTPELLGSIEYSAESHDVKLIVVLGHTGCGAVQASVDTYDDGTDALSANLASVVNYVRTSVAEVKTKSTAPDRDALVAECIRANVQKSVSLLSSRSSLLNRLVATGGLMIVGAEYALETGAVEFFAAD